MDIEGKTIALTGRFPGLTHQDAREGLEELGAEFARRLSSNVDLFFVGDKPGAKVSEASSRGIPVFGARDLLEVLGHRPQEPVEVELDQRLSADPSDLASNNPHSREVPSVACCGIDRVRRPRSAPTVLESSTPTAKTRSCWTGQPERHCPRPSFPAPKSTSGLTTGSSSPGSPATRDR